MAITQGIHHLGLTVPNIKTTRDFFVDVLEFRQVGEEPDYPAYFISDGTTMLTLWQAIAPEQAVPFDRKTNIGLHHFVLKVDSSETLKAIYEKLKGLEEVRVEFAPQNLGQGSVQHMMFYIPGGIRMELITFPN